MKKALALILALVMALSLVACGTTPAQQPEGGNDANTEANGDANTGNTDAYIRVLLVFTWKDEAGNIFSNKPQEGNDYQIVIDDLTDWIMQKSDAGVYFYYKKTVAPDAETDVLIELLRQADGVIGPENGTYKLSVDILADAVQADPPQAVADSWGVAVENREIKVQGGVSHE